jgi:hypothetical protein
MKAYGHSRKDKQECKYGCCGTKSLPFLNCRKRNDRANKKAARFAIKKDIVLAIP